MAVVGVGRGRRPRQAFRWTNVSRLVRMAAVIRVSPEAQRRSGKMYRNIQLPGRDRGCHIDPGPGLSRVAQQCRPHHASVSRADGREHHRRAYPACVRCGDGHAPMQATPLQLERRAARPPAQRPEAQKAPAANVCTVPINSASTAIVTTLHFVAHVVPLPV
jgi:hypothetical protein